MKKGSRLTIVALIAFLIVIAIGLYLLFQGRNSRGTANETLQDLTAEVNDVQESDAEEEPDSDSLLDIPEKNLDWDKLHSENEDIYAWITVTDTTVDYPVLQHLSDNSYYLNNNIDGTPGYPGCIYTENYNAKDFSDKNTVLYGHNLKDKTMFSSLHNYEDEEVFSKDQYIYVWTEDETFVYKVFAA
ncbi:MAG: sortase, partial [Pseudobutyrivibrio sp.]|nr:sortase [Pseudobutyrivibrio sp.]